MITGYLTIGALLTAMILADSKTIAKLRENVNTLKRTSVNPHGNVFVFNTLLLTSLVMSLAWPVILFRIMNGVIKKNREI